MQTQITCTHTNYMHIHTHICTFVHTNAHIHAHKVHTQAHSHTYTSMYTHMHTHTHTNTHALTHTRTHSRTHAVLSCLCSGYSICLFSLTTSNWQAFVQVYLTCTCIHMCACGDERSIADVFLNHFLPHFFNTISHQTWNSSNQLGWVTSERQGSE